MSHLWLAHLKLCCKGTLNHRQNKIKMQFFNDKSLNLVIFRTSK